ncbi:MAG: FAD:protein FMN transferase, partial [Pseudomonadota bacterium]
MKPIRLFFFVATLAFLLSSTVVEGGLKRENTISGKTMGTFYKIKYISDLHTSQGLWKQKVDTRLKEINKHLSMYDPKSELSVFNQEIIGKPVSISSDFFTMIQEGERLYQLTNGAWDGTIKPLVDLWGFGTQKKAMMIPKQETIQSALSQTGFNHIQINGPRSITKQNFITLDFGSIAKGYGVDAIAKLFVTSGIHNVLVEIGGELFASGKNKNNELWSVGISRPDKVFARQTLFKIIQLDNQAIATSGNYRNFYEIDNKTYSHIIDPKTGFPVKNKIVSASVISKDCTFADGLATALMVMDVEKGIELVNTLDGTECLIVQKIEPGLKTDQEFISHFSKNFESL